MKYKCSKCKALKSEVNFYFKKGKVQSWCKECYRQYHRNKYSPTKGQTDNPRKCRECKKEYAPKLRTESYFCSRDCKGKNRNRENKAKRIASQSDRICIGCEKIIPKTARADKKWCSEDCSSKARGHTMNVTRRIKTSEPLGVFLRVDIYNRDNWICQICKKPVDKKLSFPSPKAASLDHIVPLSRGGTHESRNVQLAHLSCNTSKGNRVNDVSSRPALLKAGKRVFTIPEAAEMAGVSLPVLQHAVALGRVRSEPRKKFESNYLSEEVVAQIFEEGIPGSRIWMRERRVRVGPKMRTMKCKHCGEKKVVEVSLNSPRSYCSTNCYQSSLRNRNKLDLKRLLEIKCSVCKRSIKGRKQVKRVNLCSKKCVNAHRRSKGVTVRTKICSVCNQTFNLPKKQGHPPATCSAACAKKWPSMKSKAWYKENKAKR